MGSLALQSTSQGAQAKCLYRFLGKFPVYKVQSL